jgi:hypothetical protein
MTTIDQVIANGPFQATWDSLKQYTVPDWSLDQGNRIKKKQSETKSGKVD